MKMPAGRSVATTWSPPPTKEVIVSRTNRSRQAAAGSCGVEAPAGGRAGEVALDQPERPARADPDGGVDGRVKQLDAVVGGVLRVLQREQPGERPRVGDHLGQALDHDRLLGVL